MSGKQKKQKVEPEEIDLSSEDELSPEAQAALDEVSKIEEKLNAIEEEKEKRLQTVIREFEVKKREVYKERSKLYQKLPHFWSKVVSVHSLLRC